MLCFFFMLFVGDGVPGTGAGGDDGHGNVDYAVSFLLRRTLSHKAGRLHVCLSLVGGGAVMKSVPPR